MASTFVFSQPDLVTCSFFMFYDMKKKEELSDVSIRIDNRVFAAHRIILAAAVPYFRTMFTCNLAESREKEVTMKGLDPVALECLIDFAYTSKVTITIENVQSLLVAAEYLQLTQVRDSCCDFLSKRLDPNNVMNVRALADSLNCPSLVENADTYISKNFEAFSQTNEFLNLSFSFLKELTRKDDLQVSSEERVFAAVMRWVKTDRNRHKMLPDLLTEIRMTFLTPQFLFKSASKEKLIMDSAPCRKLLDKAKRHHLLPEEGAAGCSFTVSERCYRQSTEDEMFLFCCNKANLLTVFKYITTTGEWNTVLNDKSRSDVRHVLVLGAEVYVFGKNTFETFNPRTLAWTPRAAFPRVHSSFKNAVPCNGKIYWFGNSENECQGLCFDNQRNKWINYAHPNLTIHHYTELLPGANGVLIFGSHSWFQPSSRRGVLLYMPEEHVSHRITEMQYERSAFGSALLGDSLYVSGGLSFYLDADPYGHCSSSLEAESLLRSTEIYNISLKVWQRASSMCKPRKNFSLLTCNNELYAIGGTTGSNDLVEVYDPAADKWTLVGGSLSCQYDFVKAVTIAGRN